MVSKTGDLPSVAPTSRRPWGEKEQVATLPWDMLQWGSMWCCVSTQKRCFTLEGTWGPWTIVIVPQGVDLQVPEVTPFLLLIELVWELWLTGCTGHNLLSKEAEKMCINLSPSYFM